MPSEPRYAYRRKTIETFVEREFHQLTHAVEKDERKFCLGALSGYRGACRALGSSYDDLVARIDAVVEFETQGEG